MTNATILVLLKFFRQKKHRQLLSFLLACSLMCLWQTHAFAQQGISGRVIDRQKNPLAGATITVAGGAATTTDAEGRFKIDAPLPAGIEVKLIGFESRTLKIQNASAVTIELTESATNLDAVTVVGYTTKKKSEISSAVSTVSGSQLNDVTSVNLGTLIQGKAPGIVASGGSGDPTSGSSIVVRGTGTINASTAPLTVVDGNIGGTYNPADVESVTILRDAAATGLYGSRAANGVVIITTKKGKAGTTTLSLNSTIGMAQATHGGFKMMNSQQLFDYQSTFTTPDRSVLNNNTDWWKLGFRNALVNNHTVTASGGTEKSQFYISGNFFKEQGTLVDNDKTQYSLRGNLSSQLSNKLKLTTMLSGNFIQDNYNPEDALYQIYLNLPYDPAYNADGLPIDPRDYADWKGRDRSNFLYGLQYNYSRARSYTTTADLNFDYNVVKNLTLSSYNRGTLYNARSNSYSDVRTSAGATNLGEAYVNNNFSSTLISSNRARYAADFGDHSLSVLAVGEVEKGYLDANTLNIKGLPAGKDATSTGTAVLSNPTGSYDNYLFAKALGQVDYSFKSKYFAVASVVNEYSSRFGQNNPSATFYQAGASWIISNEDFLKDNKILSFLKLRTSYGTTGNAEGIGYYASYGLYNIAATAAYSGLPGASPSQMANPNLTWEKSRAANIGLDFGLFNRIDVTLDVYDKQNSSLLFFRPLPATSGYGGVYENVGKIRNRGFELTINSKNIQRKDFTWETALNFSLNRNKVLEVNQGRTEVNSGASQPIGIGHNMDEWFMPVWAGVNVQTGAPEWQNLNAASGLTGTYNQATRQYTGKTSAPKFTGGIGNTLRYKNFTLSTFVNFVYGNWIYNSSRFFFDNDGLYESYNQMVLRKGWSRWENPGDVATHPKAVFGRSDASNQTSTRYLENGSYLRLRNATLGYNLPAKWTKAISLSSARVFVSGDNLFTVTGFSGTDPEVDLSNGDSYVRYPTSRRFMFGLNVTF